MGSADFLRLGDYNAVCFQCGFKRKASQMEKNWQGYWVCPEHNEPRQPQDFARGVPDNQVPPWTQPFPTVVYMYNNAQIGVGDGVNKFFQLGDGLYATSVTSVKVAGIAAPHTDNGMGGITLTTAAAHGALVTASGSEAVS